MVYGLFSAAKLAYIKKCDKKNATIKTHFFIFIKS